MGTQGDLNHGIGIYVGVYIHSFVRGKVSLVIDNYVIFAAWKIGEAKVPLGIRVHAVHRSTAVLQFDEDPTSWRIASEDSNLSDDPAGLLKLRMQGTGQDYTERRDEKGTNPAEHGLHCKRNGPVLRSENRPWKVSRG
jgi:hypothetical protein